MKSFSNMNRVMWRSLRSSTPRWNNQYNVRFFGSSKEVYDMPTDDEQATGLERRELEAEKAGVPLFGPTGLRGKFGTPADPVKVESVFDTRIVGCQGGIEEDAQHELIWHVVSHGKPLVCLECGQTFELEKISDPEYEKALAHAH